MIAVDKKNNTLCAYELIGQSLIRSVRRAGYVELSDEEKLKSIISELMPKLYFSAKKGGVCLELLSTDPLVPELSFLEEVHLACDMSCARSNPLCKDNSELKHTPFIIDRSESQKVRIYLQTDFEDEITLARYLTELAQREDTLFGNKVQTELERLKTEAENINLSSEQLRAVEMTLGKPLSIITGGPGTGKTSVVVAVLQCLFHGMPEMKVAMMAPTGKASARLSSSLTEDRINKKTGKVITAFQLVRDHIEQISSKTIHKWLVDPTEIGKRPSGDNPIDADVIVIDEASMIDSHLAKILFEVIDRKKTRVIVLGDKNQLAAVGPGSVFADISSLDGALSSHVAVLTQTHRFDEAKQIIDFARFLVDVNQEEISENDILDQAFQLIEKNQQDIDQTQTLFFNFDSPSSASGLCKEAEDWFKNHLKRYLSAIEQLPESPSTEQLEEVWKVLNSFRPLSATRKGKQSLQSLNQFADRFFKEHFKLDDDTLLYPGFVLIIRKNDSELSLSNGDVGFVYQDLKDGKTQEMVYFGDLRKSLPFQTLSIYEIAFGMTIHQSQGSGFGEVAVLLPYFKDNEEVTESASNLATRELLYTGITRSIKNCRVFGSKSALKKSILTVTKREGGFAKRLEEFKEHLRLIE